MMNWAEVDTYAKRWIMEAGMSIRESFTHSLQISSKSEPNDLVTNIDKETEQFFARNIREQFPSHRILGEEGFGDKLQSLNGVVWIIDPIDGTMNFIHQRRNFAISIGVYKDGVGHLGYIYDVVQDELYFAEKGKGAFLNDVQLPNLQQKKVEEAILNINATWLIRNKRMDPKILIPLANTVRGTRSFGSAAIEMAYIASGRLDCYITMRLSPWDFAAGKVIVEEVGGIVTDLGGNPLNLMGVNPVFVSKPGLHQEILERFLLKNTHS
ncbi:myo-inositol-1(or 4)-monophosphatase [Oikeobacillus pervagus]|uniref:inositol-phosphate phosphatase n=1 Tax=Oikeobacillus pervagus TaxID=1325931 RepID=A0AAJ1T110_9BACI|nr:inositol monophosphatase family protein [Oikeobacillus pervagus]MDQ0215187.1 myo-inositol-1(or 4)-monophosphatase [Oikeobacillus pervagus]